MWSQWCNSFWLSQRLGIGPGGRASLGRCRQFFSCSRKQTPWGTGHKALFPVPMKCNLGMHFQALQLRTAVCQVARFVDLLALQDALSMAPLEAWPISVFPPFPGWWFQPLWKILVSWGYHSQYMESHKIHVPNHQPDKFNIAIDFGDLVRG